MFANTGVWCFFTETQNNLVSSYLTDLQKQTSYSAAVIQDFLLIGLVIHTVNWPALCEHNVNVKCRRPIQLVWIKLVRTILFCVLKLPAVLLHPGALSPAKTNPWVRTGPVQEVSAPEPCWDVFKQQFLIVHVFSSSQSFRAPLERIYSPEQLKQHDKVGTCKY